MWLVLGFCMLYCCIVLTPCPVHSAVEVNWDTSIVADSDIRFCVLSSLDERFDAHLAQAENLSALFVALNDEVG